MRITKELARQIIKDTQGAGDALLEDGVSVCEYVSRRMGEELTVTQGGKLCDLIEKEKSEMLKEHHQNACATYYACGGHKKAESNMALIESYELQAVAAGITLQDRLKAAKLGKFNGEGAA